MLDEEIDPALILRRFPQSVGGKPGEATSPKNPATAVAKPILP